MPENAPILIAGSGVFGLTLGVRLAEAGLPVVILERNEEAGGLAGGYRCGSVLHDVGPKRFHTEDPAISGFIRDILQEDALGIGRESLVHFRSQYYRWPLGPRDILKLPIPLVVRTLLDLGTGRGRPEEVRTFEDYVLTLYGPTLYRHFFAAYSRKFLGLPPAETDADWASTGLQRAIIDRRLKLNSLKEMAVSALTPRGQPEAGFIYPRGGMETFIRRLVERCEKAGAQVHTRCGVEGVELSPDGTRIVAVQAGGRRFPCGMMVWSGSLRALCPMMGLEAPSLDYLKLHLYCLDVPGSPDPSFQWCYYGTPELVFSRISMPHRFDASMGIPGRTGLLLEVTQPEVERRGGSPVNLIPSLIADLRKVGLLGKKDRTGEVRHHPIPDAYPIYRTGYREELDAIRSRLSSFTNLRLGGRTGTFWYNNMDGSIGQALEMAGQVTSSWS